MIQRPQGRQAARSPRSTVGMEVLLVLYAMLATVVLIRTVLVLLHINDRIWVGSFVYGMTAPVTNALASVPGFSHGLLGPLTMVELILIGVVLLFPLGLAATAGRR